MSTEPAERLDASRLATVSVYLLERNGELASGLRTMLRGVGMSGVRAFLSADELEASLATTWPDVLILSESASSNIFEITKRIRHVALGKNPFAVILLLMSSKDPESAQAALKSGADSALMKPVASTQLVERISQLAFRRAPFVATTDYIGPERRAPGRTSEVPTFQSINTLRYKLEGKSVSPEALERAVGTLTPQLWLGRLHSYSKKLQWSCNAILELHRGKRPLEEMKASLLSLVEALVEAATTTERFGHPEMLKVCHDLAAEIAALANDPGGLDDHKITKLTLIPTAFDLALKKLGGPVPSS